MLRLTFFVAFISAVGSLRVQNQPTHLTTENGDQSSEELQEWGSSLYTSFNIGIQKVGEEGTEESVHKLHIYQDPGKKTMYARVLPISDKGGHYHGAAKFITHLTENLDIEMFRKLEKCHASLKSEDKAFDSQAVWIIINGEDPTADDLASRVPSRSVILGPGVQNKTKMELVHAQGKKVRSLFVPFASLFFAETRHSPLELMDRTVAKQSLAKKEAEKIILYQNHKCHPYRDDFFDVVCNHLQERSQTCHWNSNCHGSNKHSKKISSAAPDPYNGGVENMIPFKFHLAMEHKPTDYGYLTEKIVTPLLAGTIPVYAGDTHAPEIFDRRSVVYADVENGGRKAMAEVDNLLDNPKLYEETVSRPAVSEENFRKYFTWHSDTFKQYGDDMRQSILKEVLALCNSA